ncbi:hypothetical protein ABVV53_11035 [Novosphingobium sp. RD2P27]|uniref:NADP-dependent oxidoreductase domain-containing protein n=1 Tax=Novosphingobium kalidii TaxID=3230299 RepID=A0ABV2D289_9SPHN
MHKQIALKVVPQDGETLKEDTLTDIGKARGKSAAQVALRWVHQLMRIGWPVPQSLIESPKMLRYFDFELDEMRRVGNFAKRDHRIVGPDDLASEWDDPPLRTGE